MTTNSLARATEALGQIAAKNKKLRRHLDECKASVDQLNRESIRLDGDRSAALASITTCQAELTSLETKIGIQKTEKEKLDNTISDLSAQLVELESLLDRSEPLYKNFPTLPQPPVLAIRIDGATAIAACPPKASFPVPLILACKDVRLPDIDIHSKATSFLIIQKDWWKQTGDNKWSCDLLGHIDGKLPPATYDVSFCHLLLEGYDSNTEIKNFRITVK